MAFLVPVEQELSLDDYEAVAHLAPSVRELRAEASWLRSRLQGRTIWMVNSTARGGGVAEMLPTLVSLLRDLGFATEWAVIESEEPGFFQLTKSLHNRIHGEPGREIPAGSRLLYERENEANAAFLSERMRPGDILIVHDPQPMPIAALVRAKVPVTAIWRCHIGLDRENEASRSAWEFLHPYAAAYEHAVFSAPEYIPEFLTGRASVIFPAIDPLREKNEELHIHRVVGILANAALVASPGPLVPRPYTELALRLQSDGVFRPANVWEDIGLLTRPIVSQISRWDRLKGWHPLLEAFSRIKRGVRVNGRGETWEQRRRLDIVRLVLAGPELGSIQDDPEAREVLDEIVRLYVGLDPIVQDDIAIVTLPMASVRQNALIVNALQRASTVVVQNSLREGFGLTVTEAMWKRIPVLSNSRACGPRHQLRDRLDGRLIVDPEDPDDLARTLEEMLADHEGRRTWGRNAQRRCHDEFLVFSQLRRWLQLLGELA